MSKHRKVAEPEYHPLVRAYLTDLERALTGTEPDEREDIMIAVREHLQEALPPEGDGDVQAVLESLGPVERISREASPSTPEEPSRRAGDLGFVLSGALSIVLLALNPFVALFFAMIIGSTAFFLSRRGSGNRGLLRVAAGLCAATVLVSVVWIVALLPARSNPPEVGPTHSVESGDRP